MILADWSRVWVFTMGTEIRISDVASYDPGGGMVSAFQQDQTVIRFVANVSSPVVQRTEAVAILRDAEA